MGPADTLSHKDEVDTSNDNQDAILLPPTLFIKAIDIAFTNKITLSSPSNLLISTAFHVLDDGKALLARASKHNWHYDNGKLYFKNRLYIPETAWQDLISFIHTSETCGHSGIFHTLNLLQWDFWWPGMTTYVWKYVSGCAVCQANKVNTHTTIPALLPLKSNYTCPFQQVSVDLITDLPPSRSFDSVMVIVDHGLMKGVILCPCNKNIDAVGVAKLFFLHVFHHYGLHNKWIFDWGPQFALAFARELTHLLKYDLKLSFAYHPQTNREIERVNQELEIYLRIFCDGHPKKWADLLPMAEFSHNSATHSAINKSPFSLILGYEPRSYPPIGKTFIPALETRLGELEDFRKEALAAHKKAQRTMKEWIPSKFCLWKSGDKVWLEGRNLKLHYPSKKLALRREGSFEIIQVISSMAYKLQLLPTWKIHDVFHASLLLSYRETPEHGPNFSNPPPDLIRGEEKYKIDKILSHCGIWGWSQYLVSWKGYSAAGNMWEPEENLQHTQTLLKTYKFCHPKDFSPPAWTSTIMSIPTIPPIYTHHLPLAQRRILFPSLLQNPVATLIIERHRGFTNPTMIELCHLFQIYCIICLTHTHLCPINIPPIYATAMQIAIAEAHASILDLLHKEGFAYIVNNFPRMAVSPILAPLLQGMSEADCHLYFNNVIVPNPLLQSSALSPAIPVLPPPSDREDTPSTIVDLGTPPVRAISVDSTSSLSSYELVPTQLPSLQVTAPFNPCHLWWSRQTIFQGGLISQNARSLNAQGARLVRAIISDAEAMAAAANTAGTREDPINVDAPAYNNPAPHPPTPGPIHGPNLPCFQYQSRDHIRKNCSNYHCPYCNRIAPGHNQSVCPE